MSIGQLQQTVPPTPVRRALSKVPEVTVYFWITKVLTTGMGETASDFLFRRLGPLSVVVGGLAFAAALAVQFLVRRYVAGIYWTAVVMVSVFGTMAADVVHIGLGVPYPVSTAAFIAALILTFVVWYMVEGTLSIHSIHTKRRELFYWLTVVITFALGTAAGDLTADSMGLGFLASGVLFAVVIAVPAIAHWKLGLNAIPAFWLAYIVTRPLGACFADWMALPHSRRGLGLGTGTVTLVWTVVILAFVIYLAVSRKDTERD